MAEARKLAWQTVKEGRRSWCLLVVIELACLALILVRLMFGRNAFDAQEANGLWVMVNIGVALVAGANVFGLENRSATYRFLNHHGARPRLVWLVKLAVWSAGLALIFSPLLVLAAFFLWRSPRPIEEWYLFWSLTPLLFFAVAQLTGMVIRRGITAVVVALVLGLAVAAPQSAFVNYQMLPVEALFVLPAALLAITWAWSGDWLFDRPAPGRWLRLAALVTGASTLITGWYVSYRAWSIPDRGRVAAPAGWTEAPRRALPAAENAAELYREAWRQLTPRDDSAEFLIQNQEVLGQIHRAAALADFQLPRSANPTLLDHPDVPPVVPLCQLVSLEVIARSQKGDLAGAWNDILVLFRMGRHFTQTSGSAEYVSGLDQERLAMELSMRWALAHGQTPDQLLGALVAFRDLPPNPPPTAAIWADANLVENTLDLSSDKLSDLLYERLPESHRRSATEYARIQFINAPWERERGRRVNRLVARAVIDEAARDPWQRARETNLEILHAELSSLLARNLFPNMWSVLPRHDHNELLRRALLQVFAIRIWQLQHGGQFPDSLDRLVPALLRSLPSDPYSGQPFRFVPSRRQLVAPIDAALFPAEYNAHPAIDGSWLLYSVGYNYWDDGGNALKADYRTQPLDFVFEIPPTEGGGAKTDE